jgi:GT2 family glycosyltransferase
MNPVLLVTHNCLELTKKCVASVQEQTISVDILVIDNASTDGTREWLSEQGIKAMLFDTNIGVSIAWNVGLELAFKNHGHCLVVNNDTKLPPYFYNKLLSYDLSFVTGVSVDDLSNHPEEWKQPAEYPDFSAFLIRRSCWCAVGRFDQRMKFYASDCDYAVRAHRAGIGMVNAGVPFHHERSSTLKHATAEERTEIQAQADEDRRVFKSIYGCFPWESGYSKLFTN